MSFRLQRSTLFALIGLALAAAPPAQGDLRSTELFKYSCGGEFGRRELTLFANGTIRLREGSWERAEIFLDELSPDALAENLRVIRGAYSRRELDQIREPLAPGPGGAWIQRCEIYLHLPEQREPFSYHFSSYDVPPLAVSRLIHLADELAERARPLESEERLPEDYDPRFGDILRNVEGERYRVLRLTTDRRAVELQGIDQPLRIYVAVEDLGAEFVALEKEERAWWWRR